MACQKNDSKKRYFTTSQAGITQCGAPHKKTTPYDLPNAIFFSTNCDAIFDQVGAYFWSKSVAILVQSWWPFWFKVGGHFGSNLWRQFWSGVLRITQCCGCLVYKDFGPVRKVSFFIWLKYLIWRENLPPTWTKICHQLGQKFATNLNKSWPPNGHTIEKKRYFMSCRSLSLKPSTLDIAIT